ncbi:MAG: MCP four helix bundle domain-containing protein, partial [Campylobacterales bacterium]|nr:MCP four helix bundle domain-containing protein [Campylobacterales bacterium]
MQAFRNAKTRTKIIIAFLVLLIPFIIIALHSVRSTQNLADNMDNVINDKMKKVIMAEKFIINTTRIQQNIREIFLINDAVQTARIYETIKEVRADNEKIRETLVSSIKSEEGKKLLVKSDESNKDLIKLNEKVLELKNADKKQEAIDMLIGDNSRNLRMNQRKSLQDLVDFQKELAKKSGEDALELAKQTAWSISIFSLIGIVLSISVMLITLNMIVSSLSSIQQGLNRFFSFLNRETEKTEFINLNSEDEFGQMAIVINENIERIQKGVEEDRKLIDETITVLGEFEQGDLCQRLE